MTYRMTVDDLELVESIARHQSIGAAAKELLISQPSASRRLATMERGLGTILFDRDTTGTRATPAGREAARQAARLLSELDSLADHVAHAGDISTVAVGAIQALSPMIFAALEIELDGVAIRAEVDHGPVLLRQVQEGLLDAAFITIAKQTTVPRGLQCVTLGQSPMVVVLPAGAPELAQGARPFLGRTVIFSAIDLAGDEFHKKLSARGADPRRGATIEATVRLARHLECPAVVPEFAARWYLSAGDRIVTSPIRSGVDLSLVARSPLPHQLADAMPRIAQRVLG